MPARCRLCDCLKREAYEGSNRTLFGKLKWFDATANVRVAVVLGKRLLAIGEDLAAEVFVHNRGGAPITCGLYLGIDTARLRDCLTHRFPDIAPQQVGIETYLLKTSALGPGSHKLGVFVEPRTGSYWRKRIGAVASSMVIGVGPGRSAFGVSATFKLVKPGDG